MLQLLDDSGVEGETISQETDDIGDNVEDADNDDDDDMDDDDKDDEEGGCNSRAKEPRVSCNRSTERLTALL